MGLQQLPPAASPPSTGESCASDRLRQFLHHGHVFSSAVQEILAARYLEEVSPDPLTVPQFHLLKLIAINGQYHVGEVAQLLGVTSPAISKNIDKLEGLGLVMRTHSTGDRRVTLLSASRRGNELVQVRREMPAFTSGLRRARPQRWRLRSIDLRLLGFYRQPVLVARYEELKASRLVPVLQEFEPQEIDQLVDLLKRFSVQLFQSENVGGGFCLRCAAYGDSDCAIAHGHDNCPYRRLPRVERGHHGSGCGTEARKPSDA